MEKYIITGGAGFIGSHIAELISARGHKAVVVDNFRTGFKKNIEAINVDFVQGDIRDVDLMMDMVRGAKGVFHLAALVSVPESLNKIRECNDINVLGTLNLLDAARMNHNCKVVLSSSAAIYGNSPVLPKKEEMLPEPLTPYAVTKLDGEFYLKMYSMQWGVPTVSLRYFNVFGPRQNPNSTYAAAVPIFIQKALRNETITIYGDGLQNRDFIYVKDVARANLLAMQKGTDVYNVALGHSTTILELAENIISLTGSGSKIEFKGERAGDVKHSKAEVTKIKELGFLPAFDLSTALSETIEFYEQELLKK